MSHQLSKKELAQIVRIAISHHGYQLEPSTIADEMTISVDAKIDGIDVYDFVQELEASLGSIAWAIPWNRYSDQRASFYGWSVFLVPFWFLWRLIRWPIDGYFVPHADGGSEHLTVGHLVEVLYRQEWFEPSISAS